METIQRLVLSVACTTLLGACHTQGAYIKDDQVPKLRETVTTAEQLEKELGTPSLTIPRDDGKTMWVYQGVHNYAGAGSYIPYLSLLVGTNEKICTRLTVLVDHENGHLSDWQFSSEKDSDFWANTSDKCKAKQPKSGK